MKGRNYMDQIKSFRPDKIKKGQKIIIYGAGRYGELALRGLQHLSLQPSFFVDRSLAGTMYLGINVIAPKELENYKNDIVLIASYNYFNEMLEILQTTGIKYYYDILELLKIEYDENVLSEYALDEKKNYYKYYNVVKNSYIQGLIITHCEVVLTECCTLKCKDCANLMQYYRHPEKLDTNEIIESFNKFLDTIDILLELRLLGGEPFLCKDLDKIVKSYRNHRKVKRITIYTNATILPSATILECLKSEKISVHISDYGLQNNKILNLKTLLKKHSINYYIHKYDKWYEMGGIEKRHYNNSFKKQLYKNCIMAKCYTFYRGKFYLCPRAAHGERLGAFLNQQEEIVDFTEPIDSIETKRNEVKHILLERDFITACDFCNGSCESTRKVNAAIQLKR